MSEFNPPKLYSGKFDGSEYLELYPDVAKANVAPWEHYKNFGNKEMRKVPVNDNGKIKVGLWNDQGYLAYNTDVGTPSRWGKSGWQHYIEYGRNEERNIVIQE